MKKFRKLLMWLFMLTKRLYKKPAFLALIVAIPLIVFGYSLIAQEDSGMLSIVVACEDPSDEFSKSLLNELQASSNVIRFIEDDDPEKSRQMVYDGVVDAAWIIPSDIGVQISDYVAGTYTGRGFVTVIVREETVPLMLANEKLSAKLFVQCARSCFLQYFRQNAPEMEGLSDEQILSYFDAASVEQSLFEFSYVDSSVVSKNDRNYLLTPVRGILATLILVGGLATAMFYLTDDRTGVISWISLKMKPCVELGYQLISGINLSAVVLISLVSAGLSAGFLRELTALLMYVVCCALFSQLLRLWCGSVRGLAMLLPLLVVVVMAVCPVFVSLPSMKYLQLLFPPSYYINAVYNSRYLLYMLLYGVIVKGLYELSRAILRRV